jgi:indole-3-glycerol phosphate synthase
MSDINSGVLTGTGTYLDKIVANTLIEVADRKAQTPRNQLTPYPTAPLDFARSLRGDTIRVIAEIKHASPSKGILIDPFDPVAIARDYQQGGAAALSVLTDQVFFKGSLSDLSAVRAAVALPIIRKDFVIDSYQIAEARSVGADAILLIVGILADSLLAELYAEATGLGLAVLVEVHDAAERDRALRLNPAILGINNRDLRTFVTDLSTTERLAQGIPPEITLVGESGIFTESNVTQMAAAGCHAILVGESLITATDRHGKLKELTSVVRSMK